MTPKEIGSRPVNGSSYRISCGSSAMERASATRRAMPPESSVGIRCAAPRRPTASQLEHHQVVQQLVGQLGVLAQREGDVLVHRQVGEQRAELEQHAHLAAHGVQRRRGRARAVSRPSTRTVPRARAQRAHDDAQQRGLAAARLAHDADHRSRAGSPGRCRAAPAGPRRNRRKHSGFRRSELAAQRYIIPHGREQSVNAAVRVAALRQALRQRRGAGGRRSRGGARRGLRPGRRQRRRQDHPHQVPARPVRAPTPATIEIFGVAARSRRARAAAVLPARALHAAALPARRASSSRRMLRARRRALRRGARRSGCSTSSSSSATRSARPVRSLSKGMTQKLGLAACFLVAARSLRARRADERP